MKAPWIWPHRSEIYRDVGYQVHAYARPRTAHQRARSLRHCLCFCYGYIKGLMDAVSSEPRA